jgi:predicted enzyme related to lactoylglutathione lyase
MPRVIHFEIPTDNPEQAIAFYSKVLGWKFDKWAGPQDYWLVTTGPTDQPGINGGLMRRPEEHRSGTINGVQVESLDASIRSVETNGGRVLAPRVAIPGVGHMVYCTDPDGNVFEMMQPDPAAK